MRNCTHFCREEWTEAIQAVADRLQRQEEERMNCSPTSQIDNIGEEEMDASTTHHKRKVENDDDLLILTSKYGLYLSRKTMMKTASERGVSFLIVCITW